MPRPLVLVIEDDASVREFLETILGAEGFEVRTAADGLEGLVKTRVLSPAVLVLDLRMPAVDGLRFLDELYEEQAEIPVLVLTGDEEAAAVARGKLGTQSVLMKPVDPVLLSERVRGMAEAASTVKGQ